jgi:hypothetical protein
MPFNTFNSVAKLPKKGSSIPSITFSNPSLVTTTTHWVTDASYRVFLIEGHSTYDGTSIAPTATISNWNTAIKVFYLVIGSGGSGSADGTGISSSSGSNGGGGGGAGGFLCGDVVVFPSNTNRTISFNPGGPAGLGNTPKRESTLTIQKGVSLTTNFTATAGQGADSWSNAPTVSGTVSRQGSGGGAQGFWYRNQNYSGGTGYTNGGGSYGSEWGGGGGGAQNTGGSAGSNTSSSVSGGSGLTVPTNILGIYQKFGNTEFCRGGSSGKGQNSTPAFGANDGVFCNANYGSGGGGATYNNTTSRKLGNRGAIAIAISMNDVPL